MLVKAIEVLFMLKEYENHEVFNITFVKIINNLKDCLKQAYMNDYQ